MNPASRMLLRMWAPALAAALAPVAAALLFPGLTASWLGLLGLAALAALSSLAASAIAARRMMSAIERVSDDIESAPRQGFRRYVRGSDWGLLGDLAAAFDWLLQEVQGHLASSEKQRLDERARLEALIRSIPDGVLISNLRGELLHGNSHAVRMLGLKQEDLKPGGPGLYELLPHDSLKRAVSHILEKQASEETVELEVEGPGGLSSRHFQTTASLFTNLEDQDLGVVIVIRDVTAEAELSRFKDDFFHAVAHDLRAPLFGIQGYVRLLEKSRQFEPKAQGYIHAVYQSCDRLSRLVADILDLSRLEGPRPPLERSAVRIDDVVERVRSELAASAEEKGVRLETHVQPGLETTGDERLLMRAIENLVANGLKFTPAGGSVTIEAAPLSGGVELSVSDTGPGIPAEHLEAVFEKYRQLGRGGKGAGFGLGLTIARQVVEAHGGSIRAESGPALGARFVVTLPGK
jgi:two-component system phosphate regulon sensor histidine kinase PhoR